MWSSVSVAVPPTVRPLGLARAAFTKSSIVLYGDSVRTESISSSIATIMRIVIASRWSPGRRPSILPETIIGVAPAITCGSPFLLMRELKPTAPLPPARLFTFIGTGDHLFSSMMPVIMRIRLSVPPPGAYGTTTSTVFCGYFACATATADAAASTAPAISLCMLISSFGLLFLVIDEVRVVRAHGSEDIEVQADLVPHRLGIVHHVGRHPNHRARPAFEDFVSNVQARASLQDQHELLERMAVRTGLHARLDPVQDHHGIVAPECHAVDPV